MIWLIGILIIALLGFLGLIAFGKYVEHKWSLIEELPPRNEEVERRKLEDVEKYNAIMRHISEERRKIEKELNDGN
jgi:hypothetical protein